MQVAGARQTSLESSVPQGRWSGRLAAPLLGAPLALAFPRPGWWWLALVGLVPVLLAAMAAPDGREAALRGWLGGTGFFLAVDAFLLPKVGSFMVPLAMLLAALWLPVGWLARALLGAGGRPVGPGRLAAALVLVPSAFVAGEALRSWDALGGPWGLLGASQWNAPAPPGVRPRRAGPGPASRPAARGRPGAWPGAP